MGNSEQLIIRRFRVTETFVRCMKGATKQMQTKVNHALAKLIADPRPPGLNVEKLQGFPGIYSLRIDRGYRLSFTIDGDTAELRRFDAHDDLYRKP